MRLLMQRIARIDEGRQTRPGMPHELAKSGRIGRCSGARHEVDI